jgi:hypothetical protein
LQALLAIFNFTPVVREGYRMGVPVPGRYRELINTDAEVYGGSNIGEAKQASFFGDPRMKDDLEQQIAEFVAQGRVVFSGDRVGNFIGFFDGVWRDGRKGLLAVPFAASHRITQSRHDPEKAIYFLMLALHPNLTWIIYIM